MVEGTASCSKSPENTTAGCITRLMCGKLSLRLLFGQEPPISCVSIQLSKSSIFDMRNKVCQSVHVLIVATSRSDSLSAAITDKASGVVIHLHWPRFGPQTWLAFEASAAALCCRLPLTSHFKASLTRCRRFIRIVTVSRIPCDITAFVICGASARGRGFVLAISGFVTSNTFQALSNLHTPC